MARPITPALWAIGAGALSLLIGVGALLAGWPMGDFVFAIVAIVAGVVALRRIRAEPSLRGAGLARGGIALGSISLVITLVATTLFFAYVFGAEERGAEVVDIRLESARDGEDLRLRVHGLTNTTSVPFDGEIDYTITDEDGVVAFTSVLALEHDRFWNEPRTYTWHVNGERFEDGTTYLVRAAVTVDATGDVFEKETTFVF